MKMLEVKRVKQDSNVVFFMITHQDERLRNHYPTKNSNEIKRWGVFNNMEFISNNFACFDGYLNKVFLRGNMKEQDEKSFSVPNDFLDSFLKAIDLFNEAMGKRFKSEKTSYSDPIKDFIVSKIAKAANKKDALLAQQKTLKEEITTTNKELSLLKKQFCALNALKIS